MRRGEKASREGSFAPAHHVLAPAEPSAQGCSPAWWKSLPAFLPPLQDFPFRVVFLRKWG